MRDGWIWADDESMSSPMEFAWDDGEDEEEWEEDLDWDDEEEDELDEDWDDEDEEDEEEWEELEEEFAAEDEDSVGRRKPGRAGWN